MSNATERGVFHRLRMSEINRWQIVDTIRPQSVAEHSYRVWVLTTDLCNVLFETSHNSFDIAAAMRWALNHDLDEVFTGDIPSTIKPILNRISPGATVRLKEEVLQNTVPGAIGEMRGVMDSVAYDLVKITDILEAILFITRYAVNKSEGETVRTYLEKKVEDAIVETCKKHHRIDAKLLIDWVRDILGSNRLASTLG